MATKSDFLVRAGLTVATNTVTIGTSAYFVANGNVGIGTSSPKTRLQSTAATTLNAPSLGSATSAPFYVTNNDTAYGLLVGTNASDGHVWLQAQRTDGTATAYSITLNEAGGNVGIGRTPTLPLDISATTGNIRLTSSTGTNYAQLQAVNGSGTARFGVEGSGGGSIAAGSSAYSAVVSQAGAYSLHLGTNNTVQATIDSSGNMGIGTSSPSTKLTVSGTQTIRGVGTDGGIFTCLYMDENTSPYTSTFAGYTLSLNTGGNSARTSRLYIDNSGNVGIGTTSPGNKLHISGATNSVSGISIQSTGASGRKYTIYSASTGGLYFANDTGGGDQMVLDASGNVGIGATTPAQKLQIGVGSANDYIQFGATSYGFIVGRETSSGEFLFNATQASPYNAFKWQQAGTERMRIDSSGNLLVGTTSFSITPSQGYTFYNATNSSLNIGHANGVGSGQNYMIFAYNSGSIGGITQNGTTGVSYNVSSDYRLKENVVLMTTGLTTISALNPVTYNWISDSSEGEGFIAHELQAVIPLAVTGEKNAVNEDGSIKPQGVDYSKIVVHLVAAIKELSAEVEALKAKLA